MTSMNSINVYFDMDGVLCDFDGGVNEMCHVDIRDVTDDEMWDKIKSVDHFFYNLRPINSGVNLLKSCIGWGYNVEILTAIPKEKRHVTEAADDKIKWIHDNISPSIKVNIVTREEKKNFCLNNTDILIDDFKCNIDEWNAIGGHGILFKGGK